MTVPHALVLISIAISIYGSSRYITDTLAGKTKPNQVTWGLWALAPMIGAGAAYTAGADIWALARIFLGGFFPFLIFIASFFTKEAYWKLGIFDLFCGVLSAVALIVWVGMNDPISAVWWAIAADGFASIPTLRKCYVAPETETLATYGSLVCAYSLILPSIPEWDVKNAGFPLYLFGINVLLAFLVLRGRMRMRDRDAVPL